MTTQPALFARTRTVVLICLCLTFSATAHFVTSELWGENGEAWDPNGLLKDFTNVGYQNGNVTIPEWPVGVNVLDFGAVPNDNGDDSEAFIQAIAACPPYTAVFVPNGRYVILQQIRFDRDYIVVRGENMYETVLFFPKNLGEIYPAVYYNESYGYKGGFFYVEGGTHRSIETLTFEFREQQKGGFWEFRGANAIKYAGRTEDSWVRNIHFRNSDFGIEMTGGIKRMSIMNLYYDHYLGRVSFIESKDHRDQVAYIGIGMGNMKDCLIHNVRFTGDQFHDVDIINVPTHSVVSHMYGPNIALQHHSLGANHNLYTDVHCGVGSAAHGLQDERLMHHETYWGISRINRDWPEHSGGDFRGALRSYHVFVGYAVDYNATFTDTFYYDNIDPRWLTPINIYLAQMAYRGKPVPETPEIRPPEPPELTGDVRVLNPAEHNVRPSFGGYLKFDLRRLQDLDTIERARLKLCTSSLTGIEFTFSVEAVEDDSWTGETIFTENTTVVGELLGSVYIDDFQIHKWWEVDITDYVKREWAKDKIVSLHVDNDVQGAFVGAFHTRSGNAPQLVIERVASSVPGPPAPPTGMQTTSENGHILLDWDDNTEADFVHYNVYRTPSPDVGHPIAQGLKMSEFTDISATRDRGLSEMPDDIIFFYTVTAVDDHGYESVRSTAFVGNTLHASNNPPAFGPGPHTLPEARTGEPYSGSIAGTAIDPESDQLHYFMVSGPAWLRVAFDGTLSGTPQTHDAGTSQVVMQVNAIGGRDQVAFTFTVTDPNSPVGPPVNPPVHPPAGSPTHRPTYPPGYFYYPMMSKSMMSKSTMSSMSSKLKMKSTMSKSTSKSMTIRMKKFIKASAQNVFSSTSQDSRNYFRGSHRRAEENVPSE